MPENTFSATVEKFSVDIIWVAISEVVFFISSIAVVPLLVKCYPKEVYGLWTQVVATVFFLVPIVSLRLEQACVRFLSSIDDPDELARSLSTILWVTVLFSLIIIMLIVVGSRPLSYFLFASFNYSVLVMLAGLWTALQSQYILLTAYFKAIRRMKTYSLLNTTFQIGRLSTIAFLAVKGHSIVTVVWGVIAAYFLFSVILLFKIFLKVGLSLPNFEKLKIYLTYSLTLIPNTALLWIITMSNRFFITHEFGVAHAGIYATSYLLGTTIQFILKPFNLVLFPYAARDWDFNNHESVRLYFHYAVQFFFIISIPAAAGLAVISQPLLTIIASKEFAAGSILVFIIAVGVFLNGLFQINVLVFHLKRTTKWIPLILLLGASVCLLLNYLFIPKFGLIGAAVSTLISNVIIASAVGLYSWRTVKLRLDIKIIFKVILSSGIMSVVIYFCPNEGFINIFVSIMLGILIYSAVMLLSGGISKREREFILNFVSLPIFRKV
jgi:O-antigen/teichoic acid export membrane protein